MKKLIYLILAVTFAILAHSASGSIEVAQYSLNPAYPMGIQVGSVYVTERTAKSDLLMAVSQDTTLTAQGALGYLYKINLEGVNPYQNRLDQMKKELEEKVNEEVASLSKKKNIYTFLAGIFGLILIISLLKKEEESSRE